jgi:MFS family permease
MTDSAPVCVLYTLGYCIGPLIVAPVSEIYGRIWLLRVAYLVFPLTLVGCGASRSIGAFIALRPSWALRASSFSCWG